MSVDLWKSRDLGMLQEIVQRIDQGEYPSLEELAIATGLTPKDVQASLGALERRGYVVLDRRLSGIAGVDGITGDAYVAAGLHPGTDQSAAKLIELLTQAAEEASSEHDKAALRTAAKSLGSVSGQVLSSVLAALAAHSMGL